MYNPIIHNGSNKFGNNRWKSNSIKIHRDVFLYSDLEYDNWLLVECNPKVITFCEQPFEIILPYKSQIRKSIPDMWILYDNGDEEIVEVKYASDLEKPKVIEQIEIQQQWCKNKNLKHRVSTDVNIRNSKTLLSNYKFIIKMLKNHRKVNSNFQTQLYNDLVVNSHIKLSEYSVYNEFSSKDILNTIAFLLFHGDILADLSDNHFGLNMEVSLNNGKRL
ncbi:TnsA endonuclease N-terminal domain-containing protein [Psychrobacillus sp. FSL K6-2365]|uniref:TnsA endonuclease N-terminal domain-containing protein n=1 Tax=Psychrobacillus sp. FSL K6-2365 TaxID=2921546 RepID=UPI0030F621C1